MKTAVCSLFVTVVTALTGMALLAHAAEPAKKETAKKSPAKKEPAKKGPVVGTWIQATAYVIPKETAPEGEGYFSIIEGQNGRLYIGTHANAVNSWLVEFDPKSKKMTPVVDVHKTIGTDLKGFGSQAKIHTRNNTGKLTGKIYFGTKQGYPNTDGSEKGEDYPGGYPLAYDPKTGKCEFWPIPVKHQGINSIMPDESRGLVYLSTCSDHRPGPGENSVFLVLDLKTGKYTELMDTEHVYGFICLDNKGRAYHPVKGGKIARYDPDTQKLDLLKQTIDGQPPTEESNLGGERTHPLNWDASPDGKTLYCVPMKSNQLYSYDLTIDGDTLPGKSLGALLPEAEQNAGKLPLTKAGKRPSATDCRAMCVGPKGQVCVAITDVVSKRGVNLLHLVTYKPGDKTPQDHGVVEVTNPDFTNFKNDEGKLLPFHDGFVTIDEHRTSKVMILGVCEAQDGAIYILALHPYTLLQVKPDQL